LAIGAATGFDPLFYPLTICFCTYLYHGDHWLPHFPAINCNSSAQRWQYLL
jgi:hypothetical protein